MLDRNSHNFRKVVDILKVSPTDAMKAAINKTKHAYEEHMQLPYFLTYENIGIYLKFKLSTKDKKSKESNNIEAYNPCKINLRNKCPAHNTSSDVHDEDNLVWENKATDED